MAKYKKVTKTSHKQYKLKGNYKNLKTGDSISLGAKGVEHFKSLNLI